jgi:hypothetical protein
MSPGLAREIASSAPATSGSRSPILLLGAPITMTNNPDALRFCWNSKILVACDQHFEAGGECLFEEGTILQARPALLLRRSNVVTDEVRRELAR